MSAMNSNVSKGRQLETKAPCNVCFDLNVHQRDLAIEYLGRDPYEDDVFGMFIIRLDSLNATADAGCVSCELLKKVWDQISHDADDVLDLREFSIRAWTDPITAQKEFWVVLPQERTWIIQTEPGQTCPWIQTTFLPWDVFTPSVDQVRQFVEPRIRKCLSSHKDCSSFQDLELLVPGRLPRRLVMIENNRPLTPFPSSSHPPFRLRLVETSSEAFKMSHDTRFMALSHCWGKSQVIKTDKARLSAFKESIPWAELPLTFRDAVYVTSGLDIEFLWIDSLCIVQNEFQDWVEEAANMASTYRYAWLTIAATGAVDSGQGLFLNTGNQRLIRPGVQELQLPGLNDPLYMRRKLPLADPWGRGPDKHLARNWRRTEHTEQLTELPLMSRAWTFQERMCSTRVLHFTGEEMVFECCSNICCECGEYYARSKTAKQLLTNSGWDVSIWYSLIKDYARRALSFETDRLPALSGAATLFQKRVGQSPGIYLAGLWQSDLFKGLHWRVQGAITTRPQPALARDKLLSAPPSWSWTSILSSEIQWSPTWEYNKTVELIQIVSSCCSRVTSDDKGMVNGGCIVLRGRLCPGMVQLRGEPVSPLPLLFHKMPALEKVWGGAMMDVDISSTTKGVETYFLPLSLTQTESQAEPQAELNELNTLHGLVLRRESSAHPNSSLVSADLHENMYSRVGYGYATIGPVDADIDPSRHLFAKWRREEFAKFGEEQLLAMV